MTGWRGRGPVTGEKARAPAEAASAQALTREAEAGVPRLRPSVCVGLPYQSGGLSAVQSEARDPARQAQTDFSESSVCAEANN